MKKKKMDVDIDALQAELDGEIEQNQLVYFSKITSGSCAVSSSSNSGTISVIPSCI